MIRKLKYIQRLYTINPITRLVIYLPLKSLKNKVLARLSVNLNKNEINNELILNKMESSINKVEQKEKSTHDKEKLEANTSESSIIAENKELTGDAQSTMKLKNKLKNDKKLFKKLAKATQILMYHEGGLDNKDIKSHSPKREIFSPVPCENLWVYHFGDGDADDQIIIKEYMEATYGECMVYIFPGISYGFINFKNISDAIKLSPSESEEDTKNPKTKILSSPHKIIFSTGERTIYTFYSKIPFEQVDQNHTSNFPIASFYEEGVLPGIHLINDFITEEEEKVLLENIDKEQWNKLNNRRVQHYGYEFIYGANKINKNNKIGELPDFCNFLMKSKYILY